MRFAYTHGTQMNTATERLRMFENAAMHTDMLLTAKQAEMMAVLVERDQVSYHTIHMGNTPQSPVGPSFGERAGSHQDFIDRRRRGRGRRSASHSKRFVRVAKSLTNAAALDTALHCSSVSGGCGAAFYSKANPLLPTALSCQRLSLAGSAQLAALHAK